MVFSDFEDFLDIMKDLSFKSDTNNLQNFFGKFDFQGTRTIDHHPLFIGAILFNNNLDPKQKLNIVFNLLRLNGHENDEFKNWFHFCSFDQLHYSSGFCRRIDGNGKSKIEKYGKCIYVLT
ncbi:hypothetical protein M0811_00644 [Anaeramoeba ignava]|uniref:Uncharacterized protein n=1 Tax=Anaeramoeba ignava TaxID=1746090 RepID=A0A9Q0LIJ8_ANAIG|nr:hypothetical protein M0811_00644 [Anaeramoeba ignava]